MANRSNCYVNNAYSGYYDSSEDISNFEICDDNDEEELCISENETFVDEDNEQYYGNKSIIRKSQSAEKCRNDFMNVTNKREDVYSDRSLHSLSPVHKTPTTTSTPKKMTQVTPLNQTISIPVRRCLDVHSIKNIFQNQSVSYHARRSNSVRNFEVYNMQPKVTIQRSKSAISIVKPKFKTEKNCFSADSTFTSVSPNTMAVNSTQYNAPTNYINRNMRRNAQLSEEKCIFIRSPYNINTSFSSVRPLLAESKIRNTAVISPTYSKKPNLSAFEISTPQSCSQNITQSTASPSKNSWLQIPSQRIPICTLRTSATILLIASTLSCLLCFHIMSERGKSYEITFSLVSSFISLCLGFPCFRFQQWQWLPNRNYVSGYIILSLFSVLQTLALWFLDRYPDINQEIIDITKGALCGISTLLLGISLLGICSSYCCKYPPPDNRVSHGVDGFNV